MKFEVVGKIQLGRLKHNFTKVVEAKNDSVAKELVLSDFGGKYSIKRGKIKIDEIARSVDILLQMKTDLDNVWIHHSVITEINELIDSMLEEGRQVLAVATKDGSA